jgi:[protein-PII] uridylyltransferase
VGAQAGEVQVRVPVTRSTAPPRILWIDTAASGQLLVEVRAMDRLGLLALLARALERGGAEIQWAKVNTFGSTAADVFCVTVPCGAGTAEPRTAIEKNLLAVLGGPAVEVLEEPVGD